MKKTYTGGCHCGAVRYHVEMDLDKVISCNCSMCSKTGALHAFVPASDFTLEKGEGEQTDYQFNKKVIHHEFCKTCGIRSFSHGSSPNGEMIGINARCLDNVDPDTLTIQHFDGKNS